MTANKIGAVVLAAALIVGAVFLRQAITADDDNGGGTTDPSGPTTSRPAGSGGYQLICSTEFADICNALDASDVDVTIEPAGDTLAELAGETAVFPDAWLTLEPFPEMLVETRQRPAGLSTDVQSTVIAATEPAIAVKPQLATPIEDLCEQPIWACLGGEVGSTWDSLGVDFGGTVKLGLRDPSSEASGLLHFATALTEYFPDQPLDDSPWLAADTNFSAWKRSLSSNVFTGYLTGQAPLNLLATRQQTNVAAITTAEARVAPNATGFAQIDATPGIPFNAVLATFDGADDSVRADLEAALAEAGWDPPSGEAFPATATTFIAIRALWRQ